MAIYSVDTRPPVPRLIRWDSPDIYTFDPRVEGEWRLSPEKASMLWGEGDFVWYDDISDREAAKYMEEIRRSIKAGKSEA